MKTAAAILATLGLLSVADGKYWTALFLGAAATGTAVAGHVKQRRDVRPWQ